MLSHLAPSYDSRDFQLRSAAQSHLQLKRERSLAEATMRHLILSRQTLSLGFFDQMHDMKNPAPVPKDRFVFS